MQATRDIVERSLMSTLMDRLMEDQKNALRSKDQSRLSVIRMVRSALQNAQIAKQGELTDAEAAEVLAREVRQRRETIEEARKAGRQEMLRKEETELAMVLEYLPKQLSREEITAEARKVIAEVGARGPADRGRVMGKLMPLMRGRADGRDVSAVVEDLLTR
jgi:uncharacterized protein YqeY